MKREIAASVTALWVASCIAVALIGMRIFWTGSWYGLHLIKNLLLAWLPLFFAFQSTRLYQQGGRIGWRFSAFTVAWLLFFPNALYIFTDLVHLAGRRRETFWVDLVFVLLFALTGMLLGFLSLYLMHCMVSRRWSDRAGWFFAMIMAGLGGLGVYLGRFLRWNSWDVLLNPLDRAQELFDPEFEPIPRPNSVLFSFLFAVFFFAVYRMLHALTYLPPTHIGSSGTERGRSVREARRRLRADR